MNEEQWIILLVSLVLSFIYSRIMRRTRHQLDSLLCWEGKQGIKSKVGAIFEQKNTAPPNEWCNIPLWQWYSWMNSILDSKSLYKQYKLKWMKIYVICAEKDLYSVSKCFYFWVWNMILFFVFYVCVYFFHPFSFIWVKTSFLVLTNGFLFLLFLNLQIKNLNHFQRRRCK